MYQADSLLVDGVQRVEPLLLRLEFAELVEELLLALKVLFAELLAE